MGSESEKIRKKLEIFTNLLIEIINDSNISSSQRIIIIRKYFDEGKENIHSLLKEYCEVNKNEFTKEEIRDIKNEQSKSIIFTKKNIIPIKHQGYLKDAVNDFHNAVLSAKKRNTKQNKLKIIRCYFRIKFLTQVEEETEKEIKKSENINILKEIQKEILELSNCLKNNEKKLKAIADNLNRNEQDKNTIECKEINSEINQSIKERENTVNSLIVFQSNLNALVLSLRQKKPKSEEKFNVPSTIAKIQHYIPQFFQRNWKNEIESNKGKEEGFIRIYRYVKATNEFTTITIKNCCQEKNLYEPCQTKPTNYFEQRYCKIESEISNRFLILFSFFELLFFKKGKPEIEKIKYSNSMTIIEEDKKMLIKFLSHLSARHPYSVYGSTENINRINDYELSNEQKKIHNYDHLNKTSKERLVLNYLALENNKLEEKIKNYKIQIFVSDKPNIFFCDAITDKLVTKDNEYFLPVSPYILVWFTKNIFITDKKILPINNNIYEKFVKTYFNNYTVKEIYGIEKKYIDVVKNIANNK